MGRVRRLRKGHVDPAEARAYLRAVRGWRAGPCAALAHTRGCRLGSAGVRVAATDPGGPAPRVGGIPAPSGSIKMIVAYEVTCLGCPARREAVHLRVLLPLPGGRVEAIELEVPQLKRS